MLLLVYFSIEIQCNFIQMKILKYYNPKFQIAFSNWRELYQLPQQQLMCKEVHQGNLYYRCKGSVNRVSYLQIKKGLVQRQTIIQEHPLPF